MSWPSARNLAAAAGIGVLGAPLATWYVARSPTSVVTTGYTVTPLWLLTIAGLLVVAALLLWPWDRIIGGFAGWAALSALWSGPYALSVATWVIVGATLAMAISYAPRIAREALLILGLIEIAALTLQYAGVWFRVGEWQYNTLIPHGTFGNPRYLGAALAIIAPTAPLWAAPVFLAGIVLTKSYAALGMAAAALFIAHRAHRSSVMALALALFGSVFWVFFLRGLSWDSALSRLFVWHSALTQWSSTWASIVFGNGLGSWFADGPAAFLVPPEVFLTAHNDYLQLLYEGGLVGLAFVGCFIWRRAPLFLAHPSLIATAGISAVLPVWHLPTTALVALAALGLSVRSDGGW